MMTTSRTSKNGQQTKNAFKERNIDKLSDDIAASLHVIVEEGREAYEAEEFGMDGNSLDKDDMDEKCKKQTRATGEHLQKTRGASFAQREASNSGRTPSGVRPRRLALGQARG